MTRIVSYPDLVDAMWDVVKGTPEEREQRTLQFSDHHIGRALGISDDASYEVWADGIGQAHRDLVRLGFCEDYGELDSALWPLVNAPEVSPSARVLFLPLTRLSPFRAQVLHYAHERTICQEGGITYYRYRGLPFDEVVQDVLPTTTNDIASLNQSREQVLRAVMDLEQKNLIECEPTSGTLFVRVRLEGACWLQIGAPLLDLIDRAAKLPKHSEALAAARKVMEAYARSEQDAARDITVAIEMLENAVGGDRALPGFLGQPRPFISDLKQSAQIHRHATTPGREVLNHTQRLTRMREIMDLYMSKREAEAP